MFRHLRQLRVSAITVGQVTRFLGLCSNTPLVKVHISVDTCVTVAETHEFYNILSLACSRTCLDSLTISNSDHDSPSGQSNYRISGASLHILARFAELTTLSITTPIGFDLDDVMMAQLAAAWPNMVDLSLLIMEMDTQPSISMTLESLRALAQNCTKLESLQISFDATSIPEAGAASVVQNQLRFLGAGHSSIVSATPVARYLFGLFPRLLDIATAHK
jgi:hypothetical protein